MPTPTLTYEGQNSEVGDYDWTNAPWAQAEGGGSATVDLNGTSQGIVFGLTLTDLLAACPGLTSAAQIQSLIWRVKGGTAAESASISLLADYGEGFLFAGFEEVTGSLAWKTIDVTAGKNTIFDPLFAEIVSTVYFAISANTQPPIGTNLVSVDANELVITYAVGSPASSPVVVTHTIFLGDD